MISSKKIVIIQQ